MRRLVHLWLILTAGPVLTGASVSADESPARADKAFVQKLEGTGVSFKMVPIPAGSFMMGGAGGKADEAPPHEVKVVTFFMEEHEVTWDEYNLFLNNFPRLVRDGTVPIPQDKLADAVTYPTPLYGVTIVPELQRMGGLTGRYPAVAMTQFAARQYTKWLSKKTGRFYRLPCEAEWEYAARAGTKTAYFFGEDGARLGEYAWFAGNSQQPDGETGYHKVMTRKPNPSGLYDMYGNAAEWCVDQYAADWYSQFAGKTSDASDTINWPRTLYPRVLRGGGYDSDLAECRSASRLASTRALDAGDPEIPESAHWLADGLFIGFRVVSPVKEPNEQEKLKWWNADDPLTQKTIERDRERREVVKPGIVIK